MHFPLVGVDRWHRSGRRVACRGTPAFNRPVKSQVKDNRDLMPQQPACLRCRFAAWRGFSL